MTITVPRRAGRSRAAGHRTRTPRPPCTARSRSGQRRRPERQAVDLHRDHQGQPDAAGLRRHRRRPDRRCRLGRRDDQPRRPTPPPAPTSRTAVRTSSPTGRTSPPATTGWTLPAGQTQRSLVARHRPRPHHRRGLRPERPVAPVGASPARTATANALLRPRRRCGPSCCSPTRTSAPNVAPVASFTVKLPDRDLHGRRLRLHRHRARHRGVLRLELRRRRHRHRRLHDPHLRDQRQQDDHADRHRQPGPDEHHRRAPST